MEGIRLTYSSNASDDTGLYSKGTILKGKCIDGYVMSRTIQGRVRPLRKKCRRNGTWVGRGDAMECELITCPSLQETGYLSDDIVVLPGSCNGGIGGNIYGSERIPVKTKCRFSCIDKVKYKLLGSKIARCTKNSEWKLKGGRPKCTLRHKYKKKERKEKKKRQRKKKRLEVKGNEYSHNGRHTNTNEISESSNSYNEEVSN